MIDVGAIHPDLSDTLQRLAELTALVDGDWWIFGGAAAAIYGVEGLDIKDVDVLMTPADAQRVLHSVGITDFFDGGNDRFRSKIFGVIPLEALLRIEIMAGFEVKRAGLWQPVAYGPPVNIELPFGSVCVPQPDELIATFRLCGRPRDLERAEKLEAMR